jgi:hypothetical protein
MTDLSKPQAKERYICFQKLDLEHWLSFQEIFVKGSEDDQEI